MRNFSKIRKYLEEKSGRLERESGECHIHYEIIKTLYENPSFLDIKTIRGKYVNVGMRRKNRGGCVDIAFLTDSDLHLVECKTDYTNKGKRKTAEQLRLYHDFFRDRFKIEPKLYSAFYKWGFHKRGRTKRLRIEQVSTNYLDFILDGTL